MESLTLYTKRLTEIPYLIRVGNITDIEGYEIAPKYGTIDISSGGRNYRNVRYTRPYQYTNIGLQAPCLNLSTARNPELMELFGGTKKIFVEVTFN